jgi:hypothetical protein
MGRRGPSKRGLSTKRSIALREFALGIESLERFVRRPRTTQGYARQQKVERAMGIEPKRRVPQSLENAAFCESEKAACDWRANFRVMRDNLGLRETTLPFAI